MKWQGVLDPQPSGSGVVEHRPGKERPARSFAAKAATPRAPGMKTMPLAWCSTSPFNQPHCSSVSWHAAHAHVAQEDHVETGEFVPSGRELPDVVLVSSARFAQAGMEQQTRQLDAGIARQGVAEIAVLPPGIRFDDQDPQLLLADRHRHAHPIVVRQRFIVVRRHCQCQRHVAQRRRFPCKPVVGDPHGRNTDLLGHLVPVGGAEHHAGHVVAGQRALDRKGDANRFTEDGKGRRIQAADFDVGQAHGLAHRHRQNRNAPQPQKRCGLDGRQAGVPISVGNQHDADEVLEFGWGVGQRAV